jgi:hypothetical protein
MGKILSYRFGCVKKILCFIVAPLALRDGLRRMERSIQR